MKWGMFCLSQFPDQSRRVAGIDLDMSHYELAETLGYDTIWLAEHLFSPYSIVNSTQVLAAAVAQRTTQIKIGTAVSIVPFNHPLRTAGDFALVDILSHGRLLYGAGRAYQPPEFEALEIPMEHSRAMFEEGLEIIVKAWTEDKITHAGAFWNINEPTEVLPKPIQKPHPPVYQATSSPESFISAARHGWHPMMATTFLYRVYRDAWKDKLSESLALYEQACVKHDRDPRGAERMLLVMFLVDETTARAKARYARHLEWFYDILAGKLTQTDRIVTGYELSMSEGHKAREGGYLEFDKVEQYGAAIVGDPAKCIDQLQELKERFGLTEIGLWSNIGGIPHEHVEQSMRLAIDKVIPYV